MVDTFWRQSPLSHLNLAVRAGRGPADAGIVLTERPFQAAVNLRGRAEPEFLAAVVDAFGLMLPLNSPETATEGTVTALWLGPDEWLICGGDDGPALVDRLRGALDSHNAAVTDVSENYTIIGLSGPRAADVLAKGCPLDLHPTSFQPGHVAQTIVARADVVLHQIGADAYDIHVRRSFAEYLWTWLEDAGLEYGVAVGDG